MDTNFNESNIEKVRLLCMSFPETSERLSHGSPCFFIKEKKCFVMFVNDHHGDGNVGVWCAAAQGTQTALKAAPPDWFFIPPYVGYRGWIGIRMDRGIADDEFAEFMLEAYATIAPPKLVELLNAK